MVEWRGRIRVGWMTKRRLKLELETNHGDEKMKS